MRFEISWRHVLDEPAKGRLFEFQLLLSGSGMSAGLEIWDLKSGLEIPESEPGI
jgi:hypothetical protein